MKMREIARLVDGLNEAPIADLDLRGDRPPETANGRGPRGYSRPDYDILSSERGIRKIKNAFEKTPFVFNFFVIMPKAGDVNARSLSLTDKDSLEQFLGRPVETEGRITVVYLNNVTNLASWRPMNAWTLAHRMIHALQAYGIDGDHDIPVDRATWQPLVDLFNAVRNPELPMARYLGRFLEPATPDRELTGLSNIVFTMKSARDGLITNALDVSGEMLAQYLLVGRVTLNRAAAWDYRRTLHARNFRTPDPHIVDPIIEKAEAEINAACKETFRRLVGKIIMF